MYTHKMDTLDFNYDHHNQKEPSTAGLKTTPRRLGDPEDDKQSSAQYSTMSQVIARQQADQGEQEEKYGPYHDVNLKHADPERVLKEVILVERKLRASKVQQQLD